MSHQPPIAGGNNDPSQKKSNLPPEERFWKRYSPHHEFSLSGVTSFAVHGLVAALILLLGFFASRLLTEKQLPLESIVVAGSPNGEADGPTQGVPLTGSEAVT